MWPPAFSLSLAKNQRRRFLGLADSFVADDFVVVDDLEAGADVAAGAFVAAPLGGLLTVERDVGVGALRT